MQKQIDLHGMTCDEAEIEVDMQLFSITNKKFNNITKLLIVFGKGTRTLEQCVIDTVTSHGYQYTIPNEGAIIVNIPPNLNDL